jgi:hypothetical protein
MTRLEARTRNAGLQGGLSFYPAAIVAFGAPAQPVERLMGLQSAIARAVHVAASIGPALVSLRGRFALEVIRTASRSH